MIQRINLIMCLVFLGGCVTANKIVEIGGPANFTATASYFADLNVTLQEGGYYKSTPVDGCGGGHD